MLLPCTHCKSDFWTNNLWTFGHHRNNNAPFSAHSYHNPRLIRAHSCAFSNMIQGSMSFMVKFGGKMLYQLIKTMEILIEM